MLVCCQATTCSAGKTGMIVLKLEIYNDLNIIKGIKLIHGFCALLFEEYLFVTSAAV